MPKNKKKDKEPQRVDHPQAGMPRAKKPSQPDVPPEVRSKGGRPHNMGDAPVNPHKGTAPRNVAGGHPVKPGGAPRTQAAGAPYGEAGVAAVSKKRTIFVVIGVVVVAAVIWLLVWMFACRATGIFDPDAQTGQAPYKTAEEIQAELDRQVEEGMFNISIASVIEFADGQSSGVAYIENVPGNRYDMQVTITDDDSGDVLYESGVLQPNQFIESISLTKDLDPGSYPATATFTALDPESHEEVGKAAAKVTLNVSS